MSDKRKNVEPFPAPPSEEELLVKEARQYIKEKRAADRTAGGCLLVILGGCAICFIAFIWFLFYISSYL